MGHSLNYAGMKAKAMVAIEPGRLEMKEFDVVPPEKDQILLKNQVTSICASDPKLLWGKIALFNMFPHPIVLGHEIAGVAADIGEEAAKLYGLQEGDRITIEPIIPCGHCEWCRTQYNYHKCRPIRVYGGSMTADTPPYLFGGYAEYMYIVPGTRVCKVKDQIPYLAACLSSVIGNGVRWVKFHGQITFTQSLAISGVGSQGLAALIVGKECGAGPIVMLGLERDRARFELAREFGADFTVNVEKDDPRQAVPDLLGGSPDVVVETSGDPSAILTALDLVKMTGRVIIIGISGGKETPIPFDTYVNKGVTIIGDHGQAGNVGDAMRIINSGKYAIEKISNFTYELEDLPRALEETTNPPEDFIKGAVVFAGQLGLTL